MGQQEIFSLLKANMHVWLNTTDIAKMKSIRYDQACKHLLKMIKYPDLFVGLQTKFQEDKRNGRTFSVKYYRINSNVYKQKKPDNYIN